MRMSEKYPALAIRGKDWKDREAFNGLKSLVNLLETLRIDLVKVINSHEDQDGGVTRGARSSDPSNPPANGFVIWQSDGTGSGDDGDIMIKITDSGGTTKTGTLVDYSVL